MERAHPDHSMISSERVKNTPVFATSGDKVGDIDHLMIEKESGQVRYAVMSFGGFLGLGHEHYPLPWAALAYDEAKGGYVTGITEEQVKNAPEFSDDKWPDRAWETSLHGHYGVPPYYGGL